MWKSNNPLAAFAASWTGSSKGKASRFEHRKGRGPLADARENVKRVHLQVAGFERSCEWHELDEGHPTKRIVWGFFNAVRHHERALTGFSEDDVEAMDSLEHASDDLVATASTLYAIDPALYQVRAGVSLLAGVRGLDSKEAFERYLADLELIAEDRRARAARREMVQTEGYRSSATGVTYSAEDIAARRRRAAARDADPTGRDVSLASRLGPGGQGLQDEESNNKSMRERSERIARADRSNPHRRDNAIIAAHGVDPEAPPPGAVLSPNGYRVRSYIAQGQPQRVTFDRAEVARWVAELRELNDVPELQQREMDDHVREVDNGWRVKPPKADWKRLKVKGRELYCQVTRSFIFPDKDEAVAAYEKFMAPSTSDVERKAMLYQPPEAVTCVYCDHVPFKTIHARVMHEKYHCKSRPGVQESSSSSSEEEESDEDESEEVEPEEAVAAPQPKRACFSWPSGWW